MKFTPLDIPGLVLVEPKAWNDARGFFLEFYNQKFFAENGIRVKFVQDNHSLSKKGVLRGLHYQVKPREQAKLVRVIRGEIYDVALDIRPRSRTFGRWHGVRLSAENQKILFIPAGFAHGYVALAPQTEVFYKTSDFYSPKDERGIRWDDPFFNVRWPGGSHIISEKDRALPLWKKGRK